SSGARRSMAVVRPSCSNSLICSEGLNIRLSLRQIGLAAMRPPSTGTSSSARRFAAGRARRSTFWALASDTTDQSCQCLTSTNTHGDNRQFFILALQGFSCSKGKDRPGGPNRVPQRNCATIGIGLVWVQLGVPYDRYSLSRESLVQFNDVDRAWRRPGHVEELLECLYRGVAHQLRVHRRGGDCFQCGQALQAACRKS